MKISARIACALVVSAFAATGASAQTLTTTGLSCNNGGAVSTMHALACAGAFSGNNMNQQAAVYSQLAASFSTYTGPGSMWAYMGDPNFTGSTSGTITFSSRVTGYFAVALKSADGFSLYLWNGGAAGIGSVSFSDLGTGVNANGQTQDLSHASLYQWTGPVNNAATTPEPATLMLLGTGLAGMVMWRRRRPA